MMGMNNYMYISAQEIIVIFFNTFLTSLGILEDDRFKLIGEISQSVEDKIRYDLKVRDENWSKINFEMMVSITIAACMEIAQMMLVEYKNNFTDEELDSILKKAKASVL